MSELEVRNTICELVSSIPIFNNLEISSDQDFFELGASSLTIVDLQIQLEKRLNVEVDTSILMSNPTIDGWVEAYSMEHIHSNVKEV